MFKEGKEKTMKEERAKGGGRGRPRGMKRWIPGLAILLSCGLGAEGWAQQNGDQYAGPTNYGTDDVRNLTDNNSDAVQKMIDNADSIDWKLKGRDKYRKVGVLSCNWTNYRHAMDGTIETYGTMQGLFPVKIETNQDIRAGKYGVEFVRVRSTMTIGDYTPEQINEGIRDYLLNVVDAEMTARERQAELNMKLMDKAYEIWEKHLQAEMEVWREFNQSDREMYDKILQDVIPKLATLGYFGEHYQPKKAKKKITALDVAEDMSAREFAQAQLQRVQDLALDLIKGFPTAYSTELAQKIGDNASTRIDQLSPDFTGIVWNSYIEKMWEVAETLLTNNESHSYVKIENVNVEAFKKACKQNEMVDQLADRSIDACGTQGGVAGRKNKVCKGGGGVGGLLKEATKAGIGLALGQDPFSVGADFLKDVRDTL